MRALPNMTIIVPCDAIETEKAINAAAEYVGPVYLRLARPVVEDITKPEDKFEIGKGIVLKEGKDVTVVATGVCVYEALQAAEELAKEGIDAEVINIHTIKPLDRDLILASAKKTGKVVTVEEHSVIGGLGSAVADVLAETGAGILKKIGIQDVFGESGTALQLLHKYKLDAEGIAEGVKEFVK